LDREDYQDIGIESNVWFLKLINDYITEEKNNINISRKYQPSCLSLCEIRASSLQILVNDDIFKPFEDEQ